MPDDTASAALEAETRALAEAALGAWARRDLEGTLACFAEDVVHAINVDAAVVPFAASSTCKADVRQQLQALLDTFDFDAFVVDRMRVEGATARIGVLAYYKHKASGERFDIRFRMVLRQDGGLITRLEEYHDAAWIEAFVRLTNAAPPRQG